MKMPGVGPVIATALVALAPAASTFRRGRDLQFRAALSHGSTPAWERVARRRTTKMGERSFRRLLIVGASSATQAAASIPNTDGAWLASMLSRKPRMLVTFALAHRFHG
jgi:transposase